MGEEKKLTQAVELAGLFEKMTEHHRSAMYRAVSLLIRSKALHFCCGQGQVTAELAARNLDVTGVDFQAEAIDQAKENVPDAKFVLNDKKSRLPFDSDSFDLAFCHLGLMRCDDISSALKEMVRVTKPGCPIVASAEPDFGGRLVFPTDRLNLPINEALISAGIQPFAGRRLQKTFTQAGLTPEITCSPIIISGENDEAFFEIEWDFYESVLKKHRTRFKLDEVKQDARIARDQGHRQASIPIFQAFSVKPAK